MGSKLYQTLILGVPKAELMGGIGNVVMAIAALGVWGTATAWSDLALAEIMAAIILASSLQILQQAWAEFIPTLDEKNIALNATRIPSTSLSQSQAMQMHIERVISRFPQVAYVFSKTGTAEVVTDPMPPNSSDAFVILKPQAELPDPGLPKAELQEQIEAAVGKLAGNMVEFSQPIQLRFNELLARTRGDLAIKVFGEEFAPMTKAAEQIASILRRTPGAEDVKVEQTTGLPVLKIAINKMAYLV